MFSSHSIPSLSFSHTREEKKSIYHRSTHDKADGDTTKPKTFETDSNTRFRNNEAMLPNLQH